MELLDRFVRFMRHLDRQETYQFVGAVLGTILLVSSFFLYRYYSVTHQLERKLHYLNQERAKSQTLLSKYELVKQQREKVDALLQGDFRIKDFFIKLLQELNLLATLKQGPEINPQELTSSYREIKLDVRLSGLSMQQVVDLLFKIEQNERVYLKEMTISANKPQRTVDITLALATLEAYGTAS